MKFKAWQQAVVDLVGGSWILCTPGATYVESQGAPKRRISHATFLTLKKRGLIKMTNNDLATTGGFRAARWDLSKTGYNAYTERRGVAPQFDDTSTLEQS